MPSPTEIKIGKDIALVPADIADAMEEQDGGGLKGAWASTRDQVKTAYTDARDTITAWDAFLTVFSTSGAGPLTRLRTQPVWTNLLFVHKRWPIHRLLSLAGPCMLLVAIITWYILPGAGFYLAVAAHPDSVVNNNTAEWAPLLQKIYFVSTTISSLGYGDLVPSGFPWTLASTTAALVATVELTTSLSYVLSVLAAAIERRKLVQRIFGLVETLLEMIERTQLGEAKNSLKNYILNLASEFDHQALKHLAYPVLKFFHTPGPTHLRPGLFSSFRMHFS